MLDLPRIRPLSECADIDFVIAAAGGQRAHPDSDCRALRNSDYVLGGSIIELKVLEEDRLDKPEVQAKIAELFGNLDPDKPVVVVDPNRLDVQGLREYRSIMRGPVKAAVKSASGQLQQSRIELNPDASTVLFVINNGLTTMSHEELLAHVIDRATNDATGIDLVVVGGCYLHGDGFDIVALWPINCVAIHEDRSFDEFEALRAAWNRLAERHMTEFISGEHGDDAGKEAQTDAVFDLHGRTFVKPAIPIGAPSKFFGKRRPRRNQVSFNQVKHVALTIPWLTPVEYRRVKPALREDPLLASFEAWTAHVEEALLTSTPERPVVPVEISRGSWEAWKRRNPDTKGTTSLRLAANALYGTRASRLVHEARDVLKVEKVPRRFIWVEVELIGQDERNDIARIGSMIDGEETLIVANLRRGQYEALSLAAAHAICMGVSDILWRQDLSHAWV